MKAIPKEIQEFLTANSMWTIATAGGGRLNSVPMAFTKVLPCGRLMICDVFMKITLQNIAENPQVAISAFNAATLEGYQVKGKAKYIPDGENLEGKAAELMADAKAMTATLNLTAKGVVLIEPEEVLVATPGPDNNKAL